MGIIKGTTEYRKGNTPFWVHRIVVLLNYSAVARLLVQL